MATTVMNSNDCFKKWQRLFQMATTVYERENCRAEGASMLGGGGPGACSPGKF